VTLVPILSGVFAVAQWRNEDRKNIQEDFVRFKDDADPVILGLGLHRDGV
jgi:gentisate 1,2-dioxygenase